jgi:hypothetical protein
LSAGCFCVFDEYNGRNSHELGKQAAAEGHYFSERCSVKEGQVIVDSV